MMAKAVPAKNPPGAVPSAAGQSVISRILGAVFILPAFFWGLGTITFAAGFTAYISLNQYNLLSPPKFIGMDNYQRLFTNPAIGIALSGTLRAVILTVLLTGFTAGFIALGARWLGEKITLFIRLIFCISLAAWIPLFWGTGWAYGLSKSSLFGGLLQSISGQPLLFSSTAPWLLALAIALILFGLITSLSGLFYLSAKPQEEKRNRLWILFGLIWVITILAILAVVPQDLLLSYSILSTGSSSQALTLGIQIYRLTFVNMQFGPGSALSALLGLLATLIGLAVTILVAATGVEIRLAQKEDAAEHKMKPGLILLVVGLFCFIGFSILALLPVISAALSRTSTQAPSTLPPIVTSSGLINSFIQFIPVFILQLPISYLAALGIGGLRPLGKRSEWLLLLFGGGLFLTITPMSMAGFIINRFLNVIDTPAGLMWSSQILNVPMLFILTLFFKGQHVAWMDRKASGESTIRAAFKSLILPSIPLAVLLALLTSVVIFGDIVWPLVAVHSPEMMPLSLQLLEQMHLKFVSGGFPGFMLAPAFIQFLLAFVILALFQWFFLRRLEIRL